MPLNDLDVKELTELHVANAKDALGRYGLTEYEDCLLPASGYPALNPVACAACGETTAYRLTQVTSGRWLCVSCMADEFKGIAVEAVVKRPMLYIAGPYTHPDPVENTHRAIKVGHIIYDKTMWVPLVPHLSLLAHMVVPREEAYWYQFDLDQMAHCQAVVRLPGASTGADNEMRVAQQLGLQTVFFRDLPREACEAWLAQR
jgi:hypothetical protein